MDLINISIEQSEITRHMAFPTIKGISHSILAPDMPELCWYKVSSLGFGQENEKDGANANSEDKLLDYAASLFASCRQPFSILCEGYANCIVYAIGCQDKELVHGLLKCAFGTVKIEEYSPQFSFDSGLYANNFEAIRTDVEEMEKRETFSEIHMSRWADAAAKALTQYSGVIRLDFQPADSLSCEKLVSEARNTCDKIETYLESSIQAGDNVSEENNKDIGSNLKDKLGAHTEYNHSSSASISWKGISSKLTDLKKEAEYFIRLFSVSRMQGWTVKMIVSADEELGRLQSHDKAVREKVLLTPLTAMLTQAGYNCNWSIFGEFGSKIKENNSILLPASCVTEFISFPTTSFLGFERKKNSYYNVNLPQSDKAVPFATLMQYEEDTGVELSLPEKELNRHTFICGMTGSGKTNTVHHLLTNTGDVPFLVIEPVKGEYHSLPDIKKAYTMTAGSQDALYLNPFWFPEGSSLQYHIDYLKQIISSAFDLYSAMPNILEQCLTLIYQHCGWDFIQNKNRYASELPESMLYPTFSDLCHEVENYLDRSKFGDEVKGNYRGALLSRLQSFTSGPKGMLLNTSKHLQCDELSKEKIVISLDSLADDADKAIVMGVIIAQYYEYLKTRCIGNTKKSLQHIVVIEEAHHLFAGDTTPSSSSAEGGSGQNSSQKLVKTLNNMLAEIRAYGEGFIIVDQSPSALHSSVLKNTGVKIAHRIDYGQDIEAMQDALLLDKDDRELATLFPGQALVHYGGMRTSAKITVPICSTKEESEIIRKEEIRGNSLVNTLLEDGNLSEYVSSEIVHRIINHLLYDELDDCKDIYMLLCSAIKVAMSRFGYIELVDEIVSPHLLAEYIMAFIPAKLEEIFVNQYLTNKMIGMFIERFLTLATETKGELSKAEVDAFVSYRTHKLYPRIEEFFRYSKVEGYITVRNSIGNRVDLDIICRIVANLANLDTKSEDLEKAIKQLLTNYYFLCMPKHVENIILGVIRVINYVGYDRIREAIC